jgi:hypothetical protein
VQVYLLDLADSVLDSRWEPADKSEDDKEYRRQQWKWAEELGLKQLVELEPKKR